MGQYLPKRLSLLPAPFSTSFSSLSWLSSSIPKGNFYQKSTPQQKRRKASRRRRHRHHFPPSTLSFFLKNPLLSDSSFFIIRRAGSIIIKESSNYSPFPGLVLQVSKQPWANSTRATINTHKSLGGFAT